MGKYKTLKRDFKRVTTLQAVEDLIWRPSATLQESGQRTLGTRRENDSREHKGPECTAHEREQLNRQCKGGSWRTESLFNKWCWDNWLCKTCTLILLPYTEVDLKLPKTKYEIGHYTTCSRKDRRKTSVTVAFLRLLKYDIKKFYAAERKKELIPFAMARMELESITLSEISQAVRDKYHMISPLTGT